MKKNILIIGGASGAGLALAQYYSTDGHTVCVTGRADPAIDGIAFQTLEIGRDANRLITDINRIVEGFTGVNTLVYADGFLQRGLIDTLPDSALQTTLNAGLLAPMLLIQRLKNALPTPLKIMLLTSNSQYTPQALEAPSCAVKSGLGMLGESVVRDQAIGKVLIVAASGIDGGSGADEKDLPDLVWVSRQIVELSSGAFKYKYARVYQDPPVVEVLDALDNAFRSI